MQKLFNPVTISCLIRKCYIFVLEIYFVKKIFSIFLSVIFLASAMGITINSHFCGMKSETSLSFVKHDCCCGKGAMPKDCCKNEAKYIKITDHYSPSTQFHLAKIDVAPLLLNFSSLPTFADNSVYLLYSKHSPPPKFVDRVIAFQSFLI